MEHFDDDQNGVLDGGEQARLDEALKDMADKATKRRAVIAERRANQYKDEIWRTGVLVRDAYQTGAFLDNSYEVGEGGARFTVTNDFRTDKATFAASGSVMYGAFGEVRRQTDPMYLGFLGGVAFDTRWNRNDDEGWISALAGFEAARGGTNNTFHYFRTDLAYTTDLNAEASLFGVETRWVPFVPQLRLGSPSYFGAEDQIGILFRPALTVDYSHVARTGDFSDLNAGTDYLWGGVKAQLDVFFTTEKLEPLSFTAKYFYLHDILGSGRDSISFLEAKLKYQLTPSSFIEAVYTYGNEPRTLFERNDFLLGLTVQLGELSVAKDNDEN